MCGRAPLDTTYNQQRNIFLLSRTMTVPSPLAHSTLIPSSLAKTSYTLLVHVSHCFAMVPQHLLHPPQLFDSIAHPCMFPCLCYELCVFPFPHLLIYQHSFHWQALVSLGKLSMPYAKGTASMQMRIQVPDEFRSTAATCLSLENGGNMHSRCA